MVTCKVWMISTGKEQFYSENWDTNIEIIPSKFRDPRQKYLEQTSMDNNNNVPAGQPHQPPGFKLWYAPDYEY